jgi:four helix bundle protein
VIFSAEAEKITKSEGRSQKSEGRTEKEKGVRLKEDAGLKQRTKESAYWMELLVNAGVVSSDQLSSLLKECDELTAIFVTIINRAKDK